MLSPFFANHYTGIAGIMPGCGGIIWLNYARLWRDLLCYDFRDGATRNVIYARLWRDYLAELRQVVAGFLGEQERWRCFPSSRRFDPGGTSSKAIIAESVAYSHSGFVLKDVPGCVFSPLSPGAGTLEVQRYGGSSNHWSAPAGHFGRLVNTLAVGHLSAV